MTDDPRTVASQHSNSIELIMRFILGRAGVFYAALILISCALPFTPSWHVGATYGARFSIFGIGALVDAIRDGVKSQGFDGVFFNEGDKLVTFNVVLYLQCALYFIPLGALYVIYREIRGGASRRLQFFSASLAIIVPTLISVLSEFILQQDGFNYRQILGTVNMMTGSPNLTIGFVATLVCGILGILAAADRIKSPLFYIAKSENQIR